jgi:hypothetical protein
MARRSRTKWPVIAGIAFVVIVIAAISLLTLSTADKAQFKCEVCVTFKGVRNCGSGRATNKEDAERAATEIACSPLANGITERTQCGQSPDLQVTWK